MNLSVAWRSATARAMAALLVLSGPATALEVESKVGASDFELMCLTEQPAIVEGESAALRAWASTPDGRPVATPIAFTWEVDAGRLDAQAAATRWDLSTVTVSPQAVRKATATVTAARPDGAAAHCVVEVLIGRKLATVPDRSSIRGENVLSAKRYLFPGGDEAPGYGLYSYLLFAAPPRDAEEKARYLKTLEAYLLVLPDVDDFLERHVPPSRLNATYLPMKKAPDAGKSNDEWAANTLAAYDYATAKLLLNRLGQDLRGGPYLISVLTPLTQASVPAYLQENLAGVSPELAWDWIRFFEYLAAQQRSWSEASLRRLGLDVRNVIAVGGNVTAQVMEGLGKAVQFKPKT